MVVLVLDHTTGYILPLDAGLDASFGTEDAREVRNGGHLWCASTSTIPSVLLPRPDLTHQRP